MVIMKMRDQDVIDLADPGFSGGGCNPVRIAALIPRPSRVDQQRLSRRGNEQSCLAALDIDEVDVKGLACFRNGGCPGGDSQPQT